MKKKILLILALAVLFSACKLKLSENVGTVFIDFGGNERAADLTGLPIIKEAEMSLEINSSSQGVQKIDFKADQEKTWSGSFRVGEELSIKVTVKTTAAQWRGSARHRVTSGVNTVSIKLKKSAAVLNNLLFGAGKPHASQAPYTLTLNIGSKEIKKENIKYHNFCRDNKGRTYLAYQEGNDYYLERYTSEGVKEDKTFTLPQYSRRVIVTGDHRTGAVYLVAEIRLSMKLFRINENGTHTELTGPAIGHPTVYAVYNDILISADHHHLKMYRINGDTFSEITLSAPQPDLSEDTKISFALAGSVHGTINDLYMTENTLYVLFSGYNHSGQPHSLGGVVKYSYTADGTISRIERIGIKASHTAQNGIYATDDNNFYGPVKVVGFDEENLYIADDGVRFEFKNKRPRIKANKNRIASLNKINDKLSFVDIPVAKWIMEETVWVEPKVNPLVFFSLNKNNGNTLDKLILSNDVSGSAPIDIASNIELDTDNYRNIFYTFDRDNNFYLAGKDKLKKFTKSGNSYTEDYGFNGGYNFESSTEAPQNPAYDIVDEVLYAIGKASGGTEVLMKYDGGSWIGTSPSIDIDAEHLYTVYGGTVYSSAPHEAEININQIGSFTHKEVKFPSETDYKNVYGIFAADDFCYVLLHTRDNKQAAIAYFDVTKIDELSSPGSFPTVPVSQMKELTIEGLTHFEGLKFIGHKDGKLYIAVDGYKKMGNRVVGNINKIAQFDVKTKQFDLTAAPPDIIWFAEPDLWAGTKTLVWKKNAVGHGFDYHQLNSAGDSLPSETFKPGEVAVGADNYLTDVFCYDEGGNLYIAKFRSGFYQVCRFELQDDGSYNTTPVIAGGTSSPINISYHSPSAIAVDISGTVKDGDGNPLNLLYYESDGGIKRFTWKNYFTNAQADTSFNVSPGADKTITALASNKDGVFAAVTAVTGKETANEKYTITVKKYAHNGTLSGTVSVTEGNTNWNWSASPDADKYVSESLNALYIQDGVLYGMTTKRIGVIMKNPAIQSDNKKNPNKSVITGKLLKIGDTASFPVNGNSMRLDNTGDLNSVDDSNAADISGTFAPYRFIAVKPKKLVIASDGYHAPSYDENQMVQKNKGYIYDLETNTLDDGKDVGVEFSKIMTSNFNW